MAASKKKLLHIVEAMGGGVFTYIVDLSNGLCEEFDITIAYGVREQTPMNYEDYFDKRIKLIKIEHFTRNIRLLKDFHAICEIRDLVEEVKPDIIHLHSSKAGVLGRIGIHCHKGLKKFYTPHGYSFFMEDAGTVKKNFYLRIEKMLGKCRCTTIACSQGEYDEAKKVSRYAIRIDNGIEIDKLSKELQEIQEDANNKFTVMTLGRICRQKNPKLFNEIALKLPEVDFIWIGDGELADLLTAPNIKITGWLDRKKALKIAINSDAFMLTSLWEGLPISLLEAMYLKKVCIVSNVIGNKDVITNNINGYVCNDVGEYVFSIKQVKKHLTQKNRLTLNAYEDLLENYTVSKVSEKYSAVYRD